MYIVICFISLWAISIIITKFVSQKLQLYICVCVCNFFSFLLDFGTNPKFNMEAIQNLQRVNMPKCSFFSLLLDFGTNPKLDMAAMQKLKKVKMPKYSYCIHIFPTSDSCFQFNIDACEKV